MAFLVLTSPFIKTNRPPPRRSKNSPQMLFKHYRGLMPKQEAKRWFAVKPAKTTGNDKIITLPEVAGGAA